MNVRMFSWTARSQFIAVRLLAVVTAAALTACGGGSGTQFAPSPPSGSSSATVRTGAAASNAVSGGWSFKPLFTVSQKKASTSLAPAGPGLPLWNGSFVGTAFGTPSTYNFTMVGTDPSTTNTTTTIPVEIIPIEFRIGTKTYTPLKPVAGDTKSPLDRTLASPLFQSSVDFVQGGTDLGKTQYEDAFQRGNFWESVQTNTNYHVLFNATVARKVELRPVGSSATIINGVGMVDYFYMDDTVQSMISNVPAGTLPLILVSGVYFTEFGDACCIGGWHGVRGSDGAYAVATYMPSTVNLPGASGFSQNVSALSHELGEFIDDPLANNIACLFARLEVGDPLEYEANFGDYPYPSNGFTYDLQDLVFLPYFGAPTSTSVNGWTTFQNESLSVCQNGG